MMTAIETGLPGVFLLRASKRGDERGYLLRTYCEADFTAHRLNRLWPQSSLTYSAAKGTLRGMHLQSAPFGEIKLIRCVTGKVWDCLVDLRAGSPTRGSWRSFELSEENGDALYVPEGIAHGFLTLTPDVRMLYSMSAPYSMEHATGVRWDDPDLDIAWPEPPGLVSEKDLGLPLFREL